MPSAPAITSFRFDTDDHPADTRVDLWRAIVSVTHDAAPLETAPAAFHSHYHLWQLGNMAVSSGAFWAQSFTRTVESIRRDQIDHIGLFVQGQGTRSSQIGATETLIRPYDIQITDLAQPETSFATTGSSGTLYIPRDLAEAFLPSIASFHGHILRDSTASIVARHILALGAQLPGVPETAMPHLANATLELALACLQSLNDRAWEMSSAVVFATRGRVERYIESVLERPDLTPATIAEACNLSRSSLYRLFEPHDGIMAYIKRRRLHRIRAILVAGTDTRSLAAISQDFGFQSSAHFSREFRREFGHAPSDIRGGQASSNMNQQLPAVGPELILRSLHS